MLDTDFSFASLKAAGFDGWIPAFQISGHASLPRSPGVYVVVRHKNEPVDFLEVNPGGRFKDRDPSIDRIALQANWVDGAEVVYIGKADVLRRRLNELSKFAAGRPVAHWGGRLLWQLQGASRLLVAWRETPDANPLVVEGALIGAFRAAYGKPPFANAPHLLGR